MTGSRLGHTEADRAKAAKSLHFGRIPRALVIPPEHPQTLRSLLYFPHTRQMGHGVAGHQYPLPDSLPLGDLEISPTSQDVAGARPPSTTTHHVFSPFSPDLCVLQLLELQAFLSRAPKILSLGKWPLSRGSLSPLYTFLECGPEPELLLLVMYFPLCPSCPSQRGENTGTSERKGCWLAFGFGWGWVGKVGLRSGPHSKPCSLDSRRGPVQGSPSSPVTACQPS